MKYSYCTTVYNTKSTINEFLNSIANLLDEESELVVVDGQSKDGTYEEIINFSEMHPNVHPIRMRCSRGLGREIAIESSTGTVIIMLDADEIHLKIKGYIEKFEQDHQGKIVHFGTKEKVSGSSIGCTIGLKSTFIELGGYPDLNYSEDSYLYKVAQKFGKFTSEVILPEDAIPLLVNDLDSTTERRYTSKLFEIMIRRIRITRDILFVSGQNFSGLSKSYGLSGIKKYIIGLPLFVIGTMMKLLMSDESVDSRFERIKQEYNLN